MANARVCLLWLFVLFVGHQFVNAGPSPESAWCSLFCGGDSDDSDDDYYDIFDIFGICDGCSSSSSSTSSTDSASRPQGQKPVNIVLPPSNGLNVSISSSPSGSVMMNLMPWAAPAAGSGGDSKPKATTAAPAAATTAAAGSTGKTTAKPTTKKP